MATLGAGSLLLPKVPSERLTSESTLEQSSGFETGTSGFFIQCTKHNPMVEHMQTQFRGLEYLRLKVLAII